MANKRITELTDIGTPDPLDVLEIVDTSDTTDSPEGTSKKVKVSELGGDLQVNEIGETPISSVNQIEFDGATVTDESGGKVKVSIPGSVSQDLQSVTDAGNTTTNDLIVTDGATFQASVNSGGFIIGTNDDNASMSPTNIIITKSGVGVLDITHDYIRRAVSGGDTILNFETPTANRTITFKDESGTVALLSDITGGGATWGGITGTLSDQTDLQTALDLKSDKANTTRNFVSCKNLGSIVSGAGVGTWASLYKKLIPAGTIIDLDEIAVEGKVEALTNVQSKSIGFLINSVDDISTATEIGSSGSWVSGASRLIMRREYTQRGTNLRGISTGFSGSTDEGVSILQTTPNSDVNYVFNPAVDNWIYLAVKGNVSDTFQKTLFELKITPNLT